MAIRSWWVPIVLLLAVCSRDDGRITGGTGGSKSPNAFVHGTVICDGCGDASGASLVLFSINPEEDGYSWYPVDSTVTDSAGLFSFDSLEGGEYSITCEKSGYEGFSGYLDVMDDDTLMVDSIVLQPTITILGAFVMMNRDYYLVSLMGQSDTVVITPQSSSAERQFVMENVAPGQYIMKIAVDYTLPTQTDFYIPVDILYNPDADTVYRDTISGMVTEVVVDGTLITIDVEYALKLICILVENEGGVGKKAITPDPDAYIREYYPEVYR